MFSALVSLAAPEIARADWATVPSPPPPPPDATETVEALVRKARTLQLHQKKQWLRLGHWKRSTWRRGYESEADGDAFFAAPNGATDPQAELEATIRQFYAPPAGEDEHALCKFPARFLWLDRELGLPVELLRQRRCPKQERWFESLAPTGATVVFSSYYLGTPASAFGHTLLRINKQDVFGGSRKELLDTGINYSATVDTGNSIIYALKGLTGLFRGQFSRMPYYYKVREYNDYEARDLWEYELNLTRWQLTMLVAHIWELGSTYFDYYYLSENCSYHLLSALEAADPDLELLKHVKYPVIPADTVKALFKENGLVKSVDFRPSLRSQFRVKIAELSSAEQALVRRTAKVPEHPLPGELPVETRARILEAAADLVDLQNPEEIVFDRNSAAAAKRQRILARRAALAFAGEEVEVTGRRLEMPHSSHGSRRLWIGGGADLERGGFARFGARLALHDLADSPRGYPELSSLQFLPIEFRYWHDESKFQLDRASLVRIEHLVPMNAFVRKPSWVLDVGAARLDDSDCRCVAANLLFGTGATWATTGERFALFGLFDSTVAAGPGIDGPLGAVRLGLGASGGLRLRFTDGLIGLVTGKAHYFPAQPADLEWRADAILRWTVSDHFAAEAVASDRDVDFETSAAVLVYY